VHVHPQGGQKSFVPNLQGKVVSAPPGRARVQFLRTFLLDGDIWRVGVVNIISSFSLCFEGDY